MKYTNLRIGNYVCFNDATEHGVSGLKFPAVVKGILCGENEQSLVLSLESGLISCTIDEISGVPLDLDWLTRFGFEQEKGDTRYYSKTAPNSFVKEDIRLTVQLPDGIRRGCVYWAFWKIQGKQPEYVHELQNLFFVLSDQELTLEKQ